MNFRGGTFAACCFLGLTALTGAAEKEPFDLVDPTIGTTHCRWFFFTPGARPFGMAKPGPCTDAHLGAPHGWDAVGYDSRQDSIESFVSFREFQIGGIAVMASSGTLQTFPGRPGYREGYRSRFDQKDEVAQPGYYRVYLKDHKIKAEATSTTRVAFHRFTFDSTTPHHLIFDIGNEQGESGPVIAAFVRQSATEEIEGFVETVPQYVKAYQPGASIRMYFVARFDVAPARVGTFRGTNQFQGGTSISGPGAGMYCTLPAKAREVTIKLGQSYTSIDHARLNLDIEAQKVSFDQAREGAAQAWTNLLGRIEVNGGKETDRIKFYTGLYHALLGRGVCSDANGAYPKNDGTIGQIPLDADGHPQYNHFNSDSLWGTFWNLNQLWILAYPDFLSQYIRTHLDIFRDCGWLPDSIAASRFVSGVGTDFAGVLLSAAYNLGIRDYDTNRALAAVLKNELGWQNRPIGVGKADLKAFLDHGFVPYIENVPAFSASTADGSQFSASHTLEYSFSCAAAANMALAFGRTNDAERLIDLSKGWERLFDADTGFIRPRDPAGQFLRDFDPKKPWIGFQEGNAWQYTFYVPQDLPGLIGKLGRNVFNERLDTVFAQAEKTTFGGGKKLDAFSGLETTYNHGNQPSLHVAWLFNAGGRPSVTQYWVRRICDEFYGTSRAHGYGYGQDEDQGQLGAWYVLAAMGLFDVQGGTAHTPVMQLSTPLFRRVTIHLNSHYYPGDKFEIQVQNYSPKAIYLAEAKSNGTSLRVPEIPWKVIQDGGLLSLRASESPAK